MLSRTQKKQTMDIESNSENCQWKVKYVRKTAAS